MSRIRGKIAPTENIGLVDRMVRFFGGGALMAFGVMSALLTGHDVISAVAILLAAVESEILSLMNAGGDWEFP